MLHAVRLSCGEAVDRAGGLGLGVGASLCVSACVRAVISSLANDLTISLAAPCNLRQKVASSDLQSVGLATLLTAVAHLSRGCHHIAATSRNSVYANCAIQASLAQS